ncbi:MAG: fused MFS/spermidine synthase [Planctomycetota bacterium]
MSRYPAVLLCFVLSGAAALVYQTVWLRELSLVLGTTELAVATVLASYMAGLALGATAGGVLAARLRRPLFAYGVAELVAAALALAVPAALALARRLHDGWLGGLSELPAEGAAASTLVFALAGFLVLLAPTAVLGATLPLLVRHTVRSEEEIGARVGGLYAANTLGAVLGALLAGFWWIAALGLRGATLAGAGLNAAAFLLALLLARGAAPPVADPARPSDAPRGGPTGRASWIYPLVLLAGVASFSEEVLWTRLLAHLVGGSVAAFATMLAVFLLGIALGGAAGARFSRSPAGAAAGLAGGQLGAALCAGAAFALADRLPGLARMLGAGAAGGFAANGALAALALLPLSVCIGASFPCAVRLVARDPGDAPRATARVYGFNTVGAIAGALLAGFLLLPAWGTAGTARAGVALHALVGAAAALAFAPALGRHARMLAAAGAVGLAAVLLVPLRAPLRLLLSSPFGGLEADGEMVFAAEGRAASVVLLEQNGVWRLRTNGHPEAEIVPPGRPPYGEGLQWWLTCLPVLARPSTERMLVVGLGGGVALEGLPPSVRAADAVELEHEVVEANRAVAELRGRDPLADPRVSVAVTDARSALARTTERWDAIVSQPSHPWTAGSSHLYTREFLELVRDHLNPGGVLVQWVGSVFLDAELLASVAATVGEVFPHVRVYRPKATMLIFLASDQPLEPERNLAELDWPERTRAHFARLGLRAPEDLAARLALEDAGVRRLAESGEVCTDDRNRLAFARVGGDGAAALDAALTAYDPLPVVAGLALDGVLLAERIAQRRDERRAFAVAEALPTPLARSLARARALRALGRGGEAWEEAQTALLLDAADAEARFLAIEPRLGEVAAGQAPDEVARLVADLPDPAAAVLEGTRFAQMGDWPALAALDARLARAAPSHAAYPAAVRLRATARTADAARGDRRGRGREALALIDGLLVDDPSPHNLLLRIDAAMAADEPLAALETGRELLRWLEPGAPPLAASTGRLVASTVARLLDARGPLGGDPRVPRGRFDALQRRLAALAAP